MSYEKAAKDLEGKYLVYYYGEQDWEDEGWGLVLFQVVDGRAEVFDKPGWGCMGLDNNIMFFRALERQGIEEIVAPHHIRDFLGIPSTWFSMHEKDPEGEIELWGEYQQIYPGDDAYGMLREHRIKIKFYNVEGNNFYDYKEK